MNPPRNTSLSGFTLIELLVVIAVIAILAGLLFPVFAQARAKGRQTACVAHVRQIALAFGMYADDFDERFPPDKSKVGPIRRYEEVQGMWCLQLQPYIRNRGILHCPADNILDALRTTSGCAPELRSDPRLPAISYGANAYLVDAWAIPEWQRFQVLAGVPRPSQTLLFGDSTEPWVFSFCPDVSQGVHWSHVAYANGPPECRSGYHGGHSGAGHERHTAGSNLAYADGHVQYLPADRFSCRTELRGGTLVNRERPLIWPDSLSPEE